MKSIMIVFNQASTERVEYLLDTLEVRGFTFWENVQGRGHLNGEPHRGTHTWPEMNNAVMTVVKTTKWTTYSSPCANWTSATRK